MLPGLLMMTLNIIADALGHVRSAFPNCACNLHLKNNLLSAPAPCAPLTLVTARSLRPSVWSALLGFVLSSSRQTNLGILVKATATADAIG